MGKTFDEPQYRYHRPSSSLNKAGSQGPGGTSPGFISAGSLFTEPGRSGMRRTQKSRRPLSGSIVDRIEPGSIIAGWMMTRVPSDQAAGATMLCIGHRDGVTNCQSMRLVDRQ